LSSEADSQPTLAVRARDVRKSFEEGGVSTEVLKGISFDCHQGELLMIVGPSGCGKTTLLSCIAGTLHVNAGEIAVFGKTLTSLPPDDVTAFRMRNVGFIFQQFNLIPTLTLTENVAIPLLIAGANEDKVFERAGELLKTVGLGTRMTARPRQLSGGQQQRVAIARSLVHEPRLLICDEPTASLDGKTGHEIMELLKQVATNPKRSVIVVTHDARIFSFADRILELEDGRIKNIYDRPQDFIGRSL
jgi:putative ABC transport system ATP-binding protein